MSFEQWNGKETTVDLPLEFVQHPLGFVLDSGGSITKVIYRSREDFSGGKPIKEGKKGRLRLRCFNMGCHDEMINFLKDNCDVACDPDKETTFFLTGITTQHFKSKLEDNFNVKTKLFSELDALKICIKNAALLELRCYQATDSNFYFAKKSLELISSGADWAEKKQKSDQIPGGSSSPATGSDILKNSEDIKKLNISGATDPSSTILFGSSNPLTDGPNPVSDLLSCTNPKEWIEKHMSHKGFLEAPALLVMAGSTTFAALINDNYETMEIDYIEIGGKTLCGLAEEMLGVKDFDELMEMASKGDSSKVNTMTKDMSNSSHNEDDWYTHFDKNFAAYSMGRLSSSNARGKGSYSKEDIAAGLLEMVASAISKLAFLRAKIHHMERVYICGSLARYEVARSAIEGRFMASSVMSTFTGEPIVRLFCLENPGFLCALGVWCQNLGAEVRY